jgi:UPF0716 protein FxsA
MAALIFWIVLLFPVAEVYVLIKVGALIGFWDTFFLLVFSAVFGAYLAKVQGKIALQRIQACLLEGRIPTKEMVDGVLIFIGGLLFVFPGFISDALGLLLIFPPTRFLVRILFLGNMKANLKTYRPQGPGEGRSTERGRGSIGRTGVQDAEIVE